MCGGVLRGDTKSVYRVAACRGVLHTPLTDPRGFSSICSVTQRAGIVLRGGVLRGDVLCGRKDTLKKESIAAPRRPAVKTLKGFQLWMG